LYEESQGQELPQTWEFLTLVKEKEFNPVIKQNVLNLKIENLKI